MFTGRTVSGGPSLAFEPLSQLTAGLSFLPGADGGIWHTGLGDGGSVTAPVGSSVCVCARVPVQARGHGRAAEQISHINNHCSICYGTEERLTRCESFLCEPEYVEHPLKYVSNASA